MQPLKKKEEPIINKELVTSVCIDDFALRKRKTYGTIMVNIENRCITDMIDSRDYEEVKRWLQTFPNLKIISRDGSITYRNAISDSHPDALQVSDRFHLLKNLTSYATNYLKKKLKQHILLPLERKDSAKPVKEAKISKNAANRKLTLQEKYCKIEQLLRQGKSKTQICNEINMDVRTYDRIVSFSTEEKEKLFQTNVLLTHEEKVTQKMEKAKEVRELKIAGHSKREISRRTGLSRSTINRYLDDNFNPVHASYGKKKNGILTPYIKEIDHYLQEGIMGSVIEKEIRNKGYDGSSSTVRHYIADWKKRRKHFSDKSEPDTTLTETVKRTHIFKLLYQPLAKVKAMNQKRFELICSKYPCFEKIHKLVWSFKELLKDKNPDKLDLWIEDAGKLEIREVNSFINGLKRDLDAIKNAIRYHYSNGLAEGSLNKLKLIKRVMYGRCSFDTLRTKTLQLEKMRKFN